MSDESSKPTSGVATITYEDAHALRDEVHAELGRGASGDDAHERPTLPFPTEQEVEERVNPFRRRKKRKAAAQNPSSPRVAPLAAKRPRVNTARLPSAVTRTERHLFSLPPGVTGERWRLDLGVAQEWAVSCVIDGALHVIDERLEESILELDGEEPSAVLHVGPQTFVGCASGCLYRLDRRDQSLVCVYEFVRHDPILSLARDPRTDALLLSTETAKLYQCADPSETRLDMRRLATGAVMEHLMVDALVGEVLWSTHDGTLCSSTLHEFLPRVELALEAPLLRAALSRDGSLLYALTERGELLIIACSASRRVVHRTQVDCLDVCADARNACQGLLLQGPEVLLKTLS